MSIFAFIRVCWLRKINIFAFMRFCRFKKMNIFKSKRTSHLWGSKHLKRWTYSRSWSSAHIIRLTESNSWNYRIKMLDIVAFMKFCTFKNMNIFAFMRYFTYGFRLRETTHLGEAMTLTVRVPPRWFSIFEKTSDVWLDASFQVRGQADGLLLVSKGAHKGGGLEYQQPRCYIAKFFVSLILK